MTPLNPKLLIDAIVRQTTVLIAQISTAGGVRSPLSHVADEVFLSLAEEIERQGVSRKVVADMFGLALRTYQRKVQRLEESRTTSGRTLWEAVLEHVAANGPVRREELLQRFRGDDELAVSAVINDLVTSGLVYSSGRGDGMVYGVTSDADRKALSDGDAGEALAIVVWGIVFRAPGMTTAELLLATPAREDEVRTALARLLADRRVMRDGDGDDATLRSAAFIVSPGAAQGWEAAVFDHFQAVANGIGSKLDKRGKVDDAVIGGTTLHFGIYPGHPHAERVLGTLRRVRQELGAYWNEVAAYNRKHPFSDESATRVTFYFGQNVQSPDEVDGVGINPESNSQ